MQPIKIFQQLTIVDDKADRLDDRINKWLQKMSAEPANGFKIVNVYPIDIENKTGYTFLFYIYMYVAKKNDYMEDGK